jgi:ribonuclease HII
MILRCGIDEAGRGPLAGPVYAASVILPPDFPLALLADSKKLSCKKREAAATAIYESAAIWGIGACTHTEIDALNILRASLLAMKRAFFAMLEKMDDDARSKLGEAVVDGLYAPELNMPAGAASPHFVCRALVKADAKLPEVMAASILAKTARDAEMTRLSVLYPQYGYERHFGYPTAEHRKIIAEIGPSPIARMSFRPNREAT